MASSVPPVVVSTCSSSLVSALPRPGVWAMLVAALCFSGNTALAKLLSGQFSSMQVLFARGAVAVVGTAVVLVRARALPLPHVAGTRWFVSYAIGRGILGAIAIGCLYAALALLPLTEAVVLYSLNPVFALLGSRAFLREPITTWRAAAALGFVVGAVFVIDPTSGAAFRAAGGAAAWGARGTAVAGSVASGLAVVCARQLAAAHPTHWSSQAFWQGAACVTLAPIASFVVPFTSLTSASSAAVVAKTVGLLLAMGLAALLGQGLVGVATQHEPAGVIGVLWNLDILFSLIWQSTIFSAQVTWFQGIGVAFVVLASCVSVAEKAFTAGRAALPEGSKAELCVVPSHSPQPLIGLPDGPQAEIVESEPLRGETVTLRCCGVEAANDEAECRPNSSVEHPLRWCDPEFSGSRNNPFLPCAGPRPRDEPPFQAGGLNLPPVHPAGPAAICATVPTECHVAADEVVGDVLLG